MIKRILLLLALVAVATTTGSGCATFRRLTSDPGDVDPKLAERKAETLLAFEVQRNFAQFQAAQARWREGNLKACREALESLLVREPTHIEARLLLVQVLLSDEKFDVARGYLEQILTERPADARAQHTMGLLLHAQGKENEALVYYRRAVELEPENKEYVLSCTSVSETAAQSVDGSDNGVKIVPASATSASADDRTTSAAEFAPEVEQTLYDAERALESSDVPRSRDLLTKAVSLDPNAPRLPIRAAVLALRHKQPELAVFVLQPVAERFAASAPFHRTLGAAYYRQGNYQAAQSALAQALSLDNTSGLAYLLMGCTLEKLGQAEAAKTHLEQARRLDPRLRAQP